MVIGRVSPLGGLWWTASLCWVLILTAGNGFAANLINNASFEAGLSGVTRGGCFHLEKGTKARAAQHGSRYVSSKLPQIIFSGCEIKQLPSKVTFSLYMRSRDKKARVRLALEGPAGRIGVSKFVYLTPSWKRYSLSAFMPMIPEGDDITPKPICIPVILNHFGSHVEIDSLQLETSLKSDFKPKEGLAIGCETGMPGNLFIGEKPLLEIPLANHTDRAMSLALDLNVIDTFGNSVANQKKYLVVKPQSVTRWRMEASIDIPYGVYDAKVTVKDKSGATVADISQGFGVMRSWESLPVAAENRFGVHPKWGTSIDTECTQERWKLINALGAGWVRIFISWKMVERKRGKYDWSYYDREIGAALDNGKKVLAVFYNRTPEYAKGKGDTPGKLDLSRNMQDRLRFIRECAVRYADKVAAWELFNEPYIFYTRLRKTPHKQSDFVKDYQEYQIAVAEVLKKHAPQAELIANQLAARPGREILEFIKIAGEIGRGGDSIDLSFHDYHTAQAFSLEAKWYDAMFRRIRSNICNDADCGFDIWQTEYAFSADAQFKNPDTIYGEYKLSSRRELSEDEASRTLVKSAVLRATHGVKRDFHFLVGADQIRLNMLTLFRGRWEAPKAVAIAHSTMAHLLGDARFLASKKLPDAPGMAHVMSNGNSQVAVLWLNGKGGDGEVFCRPVEDVATIYDVYGNLIETVQAGDKGILPMADSPLFVVYKQPPTAQLKLLDMIF